VHYSDIRVMPTWGVLPVVWAVPAMRMSA